MTGITIVLLVKQPNHIGEANIYYHDIGDYLDKEEKLKIISDFKSIKNIPFKTILPNKYEDWIHQRKELPKSFIPILPAKNFQDNSKSFFISHSFGVITQRDNWAYNFSENKLNNNANRCIDFYNEELNRYNEREKKQTDARNLNKKEELQFIKKFVNKDAKRNSWGGKLCNNILRNKKIYFNADSILTSHYRPFCKQKLYYNKDLNWSHCQNPRLFPTPKHKNIVIAIPGKGNRKNFSCLVTDKIIDLNFKDAGTQCFPLYYYDKYEESSIGLLDEQTDKNGYVRKDALSDFILQKARTQYDDQSIIKDDIFYYVYGFLHSPEYRETYRDTLRKEFPKIPLIENKDNFYAFSKIGKKLADLHLNYEKVEPHPEVEVIESNINIDDEAFNERKFYVGTSKMKYKDNQTTIRYNDYITLRNIPLSAYNYMVNGTPAIEWVMDRYQISTDEDSGITNDPNDWSKESGNPRYILDLLLSVINVSVKTLDLVEQLPKIKFE